MALELIVENQSKIYQRNWYIKNKAEVSVNQKLRKQGLPIISTKQKKKNCTICKINKRISCFTHKLDTCDLCYTTPKCHVCNINPPGYTNTGNTRRRRPCKECIKAKEDPIKKKLAARKYGLKQYGLSIGDYNNLLTQQNNSCKICKTHESKLNKILAVDHCHTTSKVRGLLCEDCNRGLGMFRDNIESLQNAIQYLNETKEN